MKMENRDNIYGNLSDKTKYLHIISMITTALKPYKIIRFSNDDIVFARRDQTDTNKRSKWFYNKLVKYKAKKAKAIRKWSEYFACEIDWSLVSVNKFKYQLEVKFTEFNFKMVNNILPTKSNLMRWKKANDSRCIYCSCEIHDTKHMLWECTNLNQLWEKIG